MKLQMKIREIFRDVIGKNTQHCKVEYGYLSPTFSGSDTSALQNIADNR